METKHFDPGPGGFFGYNEEDHRLEKDFREGDYWGLLTSIDIHDCNPDLIRDGEAIKDFVTQLCNLIGMQKYGPTQLAFFGEDEKVAGYSMTQLIQTSLISGHFANASNTAYIDIFSCRYYDNKVASEFATKFFGGKQTFVHVCLRK